jgi:hypothetical protein
LSGKKSGVLKMRISNAVYGVYERKKSMDDENVSKMEKEF